MDVGFDALLQDAGKFGFFKEKWSVKAKVDLDMAILLKRAFFKLRAESDELYGLRSQDPGFVQIAFLCGYPEVPENVQLVSIIFMKKFSRQRQTFLGSSAVVKSLLENDGLVPGDAADSEIAYAGVAGRKRELLEYREQPREHFLLLKAGKPDA